MTGWYIFFGGRHRAKIIKKRIHTLEVLLRTNRRLRTIEVVDVNIDRKSLVEKDVNKLILILVP